MTLFGGDDIDIIGSSRAVVVGMMMIIMSMVFAGGSWCAAGGSAPSVGSRGTADDLFVRRRAIRIFKIAVPDVISRR